MALDLNTNVDPRTIDTWIDEVKPKVDRLNAHVYALTWVIFVDIVRSLARIRNEPPPLRLYRDDREFFQNLNLVMHTCQVSEEGAKYLQQQSLAEGATNPSDIGFCNDRSVLLEFLQKSLLYTTPMIKFVSLSSIRLICSLEPN